jgi:hypothetical protein
MPPRGARGIAMRSLVKDGNTHLMGQLTEYRYLPAQYFHNSTTVICGHKFATMILDPATAEDTATATRLSRSSRPGCAPKLQARAIFLHVDAAVEALGCRLRDFGTINSA